MRKRSSNPKNSGNNKRNRNPKNAIAIIPNITIKPTTAKRR
jgi:hypothetical protein